jgi:Flp pilus assembly protein TadD
MSLLLQALQKASKNRDGSDGRQTGGDRAGDDALSLEPLAEPELRNEDLTAHGGPTPAQAARVLRANEAPAYSIVDWVRDRPVPVLIAAAVLFAVAYGLYVYIQIANPGMFRTQPPAPPPAQPVAAPPAAIPVESVAAETKISGMPSIEPVAGAADPAAATAQGSAASAPRTAAARPARAPAPTEPARTSAAPRQPSQTSDAARQPSTTSAPERAASVAAASPSLPEPETIEIGSALDAVAMGQPSATPGDSIAVQRQAGGVLPVNPTLMAAYEALEAGDYPRAKMLYSEVARAEPRNSDALLGLGAIALKENRTDDASQFFARVLEAEPRNAHAQAGLISLIGRADPLAAESRLKLLLSRSPSAFAYFTLGNLYADQGQWPGAQQAYFQAAQLQPDNPDYAFNLAVGLEHIGQPRLALDYYRRALDLSFRKGRANFDQNLAIQRVGQLSARVE